MSIYEFQPLLIFIICVAAAFGAVMGSFLNCMAYRLAHNESFIKGKSRCPKCGHELKACELIPVFSWLFQKGRCRVCKEKISARYPLSEVFFALITVLCLLRFDLTILCLRNYIFLCCLFALALTDMESMIIPNGFPIVMAAVWFACAPAVPGNLPDFLRSLLACAVYGGGMLAVSLLLDRILGRDSLGGGDIKLIGVSALYLGLAGTLFMLMAACIFGLVYALARRKKTKGNPFPFGPFIALACALMCLYGGPLVDWYLRLITF